MHCSTDGPNAETVETFHLGVVLCSRMIFSENTDYVFKKVFAETLGDKAALGSVSWF